VAHAVVFVVFNLTGTRDSQGGKGRGEKDLKNIF